MKALGPSYKGVLYLGRQARRRTGYEACRAVRSGGPIFFIGCSRDVSWVFLFHILALVCLFVSALRTGMPNVQKTLKDAVSVVVNHIDCAGHWL